MAREVVVPEVGEAGMEVTFVRWLKGEGDHVRAGETLFELDTDKSVMEVEAFAEGKLAELRVAEGDIVEPRQVVATLVALDEELPESEPTAPASHTEPRTDGTQADSASGGARERDSEPARVDGRGGVHASPKARRIARERGIDLSRVAGSGPDGSVTERDLDSSAPGHDETAARSERTRGAVAEMTTTSWRTTPHFHVRLEADVTDALEHGKPMSLVCAAVAKALARHPECNLVREGERLFRRESVDLGILVDTTEGLLLPVVRDAETLSLEQMALFVSEAAARAREGRLTSEDYGQKSISVSNLGMFAVDQLTGVIPAGDTLLLGVGRARTVPRLSENGWIARRVLDLTLSVDHRALDGADAGRLLTTLEDLLAVPGELS